MEWIFFLKEMNDSSNFISHILNIVHFQGIICTFLYSFQKRNIMKLPIINGPRNSSYLSIVKNLDIKERKPSFHVCGEIFAWKWVRFKKMQGIG